MCRFSVLTHLLKLGHSLGSVLTPSPLLLVNFTRLWSYLWQCLLKEHMWSPVCVCMHSVMSNFATPWSVTRQAPLSMEFSRQDYWSGLPFPPPGDLPKPEVKPASLASPALAGELFISCTTWEVLGLKNLMWLPTFAHGVCSALSFLPPPSTLARQGTPGTVLHSRLHHQAPSTAWQSASVQMNE